MEAKSWRNCGIDKKIPICYDIYVGRPVRAALCCYQKSTSLNDENYRHAQRHNIKKSLRYTRRLFLYVQEKELTIIFS